MRRATSNVPGSLRSGSDAVVSLVAMIVSKTAAGAQGPGRRH
jgi:hypothetical protein